MRLKILTILSLALLFTLSCSQPITEVGSHVNEEEKRRITENPELKEFPPSTGGISWTLNQGFQLSYDNPNAYRIPPKKANYDEVEVIRKINGSTSNWPVNGYIGGYPVVGWRYQPLSWPSRFVKWGSDWWQGDWEWYNFARRRLKDIWDTKYWNERHDVGYIAPNVVKVGNSYMLYFTQEWRIYNEKNEYTDYNNHYKLHYRVSATAGESWNDKKKLLFIDETDLADTSKTHLDSIRKGIKFSSVNYIDGQLKMWYLGKDDTGKDKDWRVYYAQVDDNTILESWTFLSPRNNTLLLSLDTTMRGFDSEKIDEATVVKANNSYHMWYTGFDGSNYKIGYANSQNGQKNWLKLGKPVFSGTGGQFDKDGVADPHVIFEDGIYKMWYAGLTKTKVNGKEKEHWQIGLAYSHDGKVFQYHDPSNYIPLKIKEGNYDLRYPCVVRDGDQYKIWFSFRDAGNFDDPWKIGYATSPVVK